MTTHISKKMILSEHIGCFGEFNPGDPVCRKICALNLRCAIERDQNNQMELLEDLISPEDMFIKIQ
ncbi:hypothetical protein DENIS_0002 [Desulfonema ishimotonii]|uniref:Uncharacterized protein n=1 Tax=Desulfonema ishimotonii TaxID=45657 RepID=A0A401FQ78_9BACT|nr:hypothetical protein [Desulfonema ishimotonii]GBC59072.1 hypothetical protein DENIS_0002 [Desulfonema ishimotonii]